MNEQTPTRALICGLNWSGSGAVFDLLKEYAPAVVPVSGGALDFAAEGGLRLLGEFEMFRAPGFIGDRVLGLDSYFTQYGAQRAIRRQVFSFRFKVLQVMCKARRCKAIWDAAKLYRQVVKTKYSLIKLLDQLEGTRDLKQRNVLSRAWLEGVVDIVGARGSKCILLDQAIHLGQHEQVWQDFFSPFKIIVVHRDPRDVFAEQEKHRYLFREQLSANEICLYGDSIDDAIRCRADVMLARMRLVDRLIEQVPSANLLVLRFEDLVHQYDGSIAAIQRFLGLVPTDHAKPKAFFVPANSARNIGIAGQAEVTIPPPILAPLAQWYEDHKSHFCE